MRPARRSEARERGGEQRRFVTEAFLRCVRAAGRAGWPAVILLIWCAVLGGAGGPAAGQVAILGETPRREFAVALRGQLADRTILSATGVEDVDAPGAIAAWVVFEPARFRGLLPANRGTAVWMASTRAEREALLAQGLPDGDVVLLARPDPEARAESLLQLFPLAHRIALVAADAASEPEVEAMARERPSRFEIIRVDPAIRLPVQLRGFELACFTGRPEPVAEAVAEAAGTGIPLVTLSRAPVRAGQTVAGLTADPVTLALQVSAAIRSIEENRRPTAAESAGAVHVRADLEAIRSTRFHLNLAALDVLSGTVTQAAEELSRVEAFLTRYQDAVFRRETGAYEALWAPGLIDADAVEAFRRLTESASELRVELKPPRVLDYARDPDAVVLYVGQWYHYVDRASGRRGSLPSTVVRFELVRDGDAFRMIQQGRAEP